MHDELIFNAKKRNKRKNILSQLDDMDESVILTSSIKVKDPDTKPKKPKTNSEPMTDTDEWMNELMSFSTPKPKKNKSKKFKGFNLDGDDIDASVAKKKRGKKKEGELKDYNKEFAPELSLLNSLFAQQSKFTDALQKKYDSIENSKSTARGVGKFTTDLIVAINSARSTTLQIVDKTISTKEKIANLTVKERKEFGNKNSSEGQNNAAFASTYLKQIMQAGRNTMMSSAGYLAPENVSNEPAYEDIDGEDLFGDIELSLGDNNRDESVTKFLKYDQEDIEVCVERYDDGNWAYVAIRPNGDRVDDYPMPALCKMTFNTSVGKAISEYGQKYRII